MFCFGLGYSALVLAQRLMAEGWAVAATCRSDARASELRELGIAAHPFDRGNRLVEFERAFAGATHLLSSVPPDETGDAVLDMFGAVIAMRGGLRWIGYLSTTGVYGDTNGTIVDELSPLKPTSARSKRRVEAENRWLALHHVHGSPVHIFRLAGIYGPGRSPLDRVRAGTAQRIEKPGHTFGRIHVEDITNVLMASMADPAPGAIYNVCDDKPAAPAEVIEFACDLLGVEPPSLIPFDEASKSMSAMALSFWRDNRRVDNSKIKRKLGVALAYPTYRKGLIAILDAEKK